MLGVTHTYIDCNVRWCKYNDRGVCDPPDAKDLESKRIEIKNGECETYRGRRPNDKRKKGM